MKTIFNFLRIAFVTMFIMMLFPLIAFCDGTVTTGSSVDIWNILTIVLGILGFLFASFFTLTKGKLKQAIALLQAFSDAIEDNKVDANERTDLVAKFKTLFKKKTV